jgi:methionyl-tRNA formyltransferase
MPRFKIVFMGTPEFAVPSLSGLLDGPDLVTAVVTQPDRPRGRGKKLCPSPVKALAIERRLPVLQPEKARNPEFIEEIRRLSPDLLVVAAYGQILPQELLDVPKIMPINVHGSLLPKYRGAAPIQCAIMECEEKTGITIMKMDAGMDTGPVLLKEELEIGKDETFGALYRRMADLGADLLKKTLDALEKGMIFPQPQPEEGITYAPLIKPEMTRIDWSKSARKIACLIRALDPKPGAYTMMNDIKIKLFRPDAGANLVFAQSVISCDPGTILRADEQGILVATGDGLLLAKEILYPGKRRMSVREFLVGNRITPETVLG